ncbi:hypothetical protein E6C27_scaffold274G006350 [Cucumis melo var. makuwa]|uniref:Uncharacterized protein n=1 Tax=Cucumis melo var. makuwa TaxID=1194695 RepID=A0A5A7UXU1_CUCMM|nr:hypothetical protein E6C27_scaffold274G006350 [Cucumis melo var. makuwa]
METIPYVSIVRSLLYAQTCTRPDISFAMGMLGVTIVTFKHDCVTLVLLTQQVSRSIFEIREQTRAGALRSSASTLQGLRQVLRLLPPRGVFSDLPEIYVSPSWAFYQSLLCQQGLPGLLCLPPGPG